MFRREPGAGCPPGHSGIVSVLSGGDPLERQHSVELLLVLVPAGEGLKHAGLVGRGDGLVLPEGAGGLEGAEPGVCIW